MKMIFSTRSIFCIWFLALLSRISNAQPTLKRRFTPSTTVSANQNEHHNRNGISSSYENELDHQRALWELAASHHDGAVFLSMSVAPGSQQSMSYFQSFSIPPLGKDMPSGMSYSMSYAPTKEMSFPGFSMNYPSTIDYPGFSMSYPSTIDYPGFSMSYPSTIDYSGFSMSYPSTIDYPGFSTSYPSTIDYPGFSMSYSSTINNQGFSMSYPSTIDYPGFSMSYPSTVQMSYPSTIEMSYPGISMSYPSTSQMSYPESTMSDETASSTGIAGALYRFHQGFAVDLQEEYQYCMYTGATCHGTQATPTEAVLGNFPFDEDAVLFCSLEGSQADELSIHVVRVIDEPGDKVGLELVISGDDSHYNSIFMRGEVDGGNFLFWHSSDSVPTSIEAILRLNVYYGIADIYLTLCSDEDGDFYSFIGGLSSDDPAGHEKMTTGAGLSSEAEMLVPTTTFLLGVFGLVAMGIVAWFFVISRSKRRVTSINAPSSRERNAAQLALV